MAGVLIALIIFLTVAGVAGWLVYQRLRTVSREHKSFERGLKMVPMMIHLPPPSDDIEGGQRDTRDVADEAISKAQVIYNIIGSTVTKGFKSNFYGQRHFAFEIVASQGFVNFYAAVPVSLVEVVSQAIVSAYPAARLEETSEHNMFNKAGKLSGIAGGELNLKESYAYPIATYQDLKRDALQSVLNSLSTLEKEDGAAIQIVLRPAENEWRKASHSLANSKRKGTDKKLKPMEMLTQIVLAFARPPDEKKDGGSKKELSNLEQSNLDSIDEKTRHVGYETQIRIIVSSNISQRSQALTSSIVSSFSLFDAPGKNGFKFSPSKDPAQLVADYNLRAYSERKKPNILNAVELATIFHFPDQSNLPTTQVVRQDSKQVDGPRNVPDTGLMLGYNEFRGVKKPIRIALGDRQRHMYAVGQTGTGKSTFLENLAFQDMINGDGFAFVDPHGDTAEKLLSMIPQNRTEDLIYFSPADMDNPLGLNLFEFDNPDQKDFLIQEALNMLYKLYDPQHQGIMGPRYEHLFRMAALTVMADPAGGTFVDIPKLFRDPAYVKQKLQYITDQNVREFWEKEMPQSQRSNDFGEVVSWFVSKFGAFLSNEMMRNIIGQTNSAFNLRDIMDNKKILLVNLSKGRLGDMNSKLLGMIFVMKIQAAAMSRANIPEDERVDFSLYVDEFQNFSTDSFATIMSEARKYHLNLIVANQFTTQLTPEIRDAVFGNMGTVVSFRIGQNDVESITKYFQPTFDTDDLLRIPNHNSIIRTLIGGVPTQPFSMSMLQPLGNPNPKLAGALKQLSATKYGRPRAEVETEIFARMATKTPDKPAFGVPAAGSPPASGAPTAAAPKPAGPTGTGNFLDEWMAKRPVGAPPTNAPAAPNFSSTPPMAAPAPVLNAAPAMTTPSPSVPELAAVTPQLQTAAPALGLLSEPSNSVAPDDFQAESPSGAGAFPSSADSIMRQHGAATASEIAERDTTIRNISSTENDSDEVSKIAGELRHNLGVQGSSAPDQASMQPGSSIVPSVPSSVDNVQTNPVPPLPAVMATPEASNPDDTIQIDHEGNLAINDQ
ncbi:ATP-binding protein [Aeromicrobium sp.]|nr:ATP-binding protein [Candidatus Saccharibacteria bacterium]